MLLVHQSGSVKVGEVVRYTLTYTPSTDRILPSPSHLHVKIKNTSATALRAAYLHGPYTLHVSTYPSTFNPNQKFETSRRDGTPNFEPLLKAGGHWRSSLTVPEDIKESGQKVNSKRNIDGSPKTVTWIIEIASQILFSNSASVHYELLVGRDERCLELGFAAVAGKGHGEPGQIKDFKSRSDEDAKRPSVLPKGVYSKAVELVVEDTAALWDKPEMPRWKGDGSSPETHSTSNAESSAPQREQKQKKLHLVILTHGLHSNVGADMLFLKESIDNAAKQARLDSRKRRAQLRKKGYGSKEAKDQADRNVPVEANDTKGPANVSGGQDRLDENEDDEDSDDEQVVVRGFAGNAVRTEKGIQYLGKRLAKFILTTTYPDQPFLPASKSLRRSFTGNSFSNASPKSSLYTAAHTGEGMIRPLSQFEKLPYTFTSISFIGHSLGGLVQTYAIAYIHKHAPDFFAQIKPVNFVAMASPLLGLSNENPLYIKFALDFGLVGRTGQDLGLTWRPPTIARSGWSAMISGFGSGSPEQDKHEDPRAKPLLRILPTGPAHQVLKMFRNRTVYSNVVNDGIVPLRTSCLLFLDWRGLDRVENARRENGLIGTMAAFGWAELTGANTSSHRPHFTKELDDAMSHDSDDNSRSRNGSADAVPQPSPDVTKEDNSMQRHESHVSASTESEEKSSTDVAALQDSMDEGAVKSPFSHSNPLTDLLNIFKPAGTKPHPVKPQKIPTKTKKTLRRAQTLPQESLQSPDGAPPEHSADRRPVATRGDSMNQDPNGAPPPKTSVFTAAGDILNPPIPPMSWLLDPSTRARTIFHDRIYHPEDIPSPPPQKRPRLGRSFSSSTSSFNSDIPNTPAARATSIYDSGMKVEEKIARAYHRDLSWRKVLVRLEPDAHNNMVVRRMFANAYGWDVIKHLCDTHFGDNATSLTRDEEESNEERAKPINQPVEDGDQTNTDQTPSKHAVEGPQRAKDRTFSETREEADSVPDLRSPFTGMDNLVSAIVPGSGSGRSNRHHSAISEDSAIWDDDVLGTADEVEEESDEEAFNPVEALQNPVETFHRFWKGDRKVGRVDQPSSGSAQTQHHRHQLRLRMDHSPSPSPRQDYRPEVANNLTESPVEDGNLRDPDPAELELPLVPPRPRGTLARDDDEGSSTAQMSGGDVSELGLQKPPEAHLVGPPAGSSPTERVARLSGGSSEE